GLLRQHLQQQPLPACVKERTVVELDAQEVLLRRLVEGEEVVADLLLAGPEVVGAFLELLVLLAPDDARGRRPDAGAPRGPGGVHDARVVRGIAPAVPAPRAVGPGRGDAAVEAEPLRHAPDDRPADVA